MNEDLELQQYLFDLQGYVVIENALDEDELNALNALLDEREIPEPGKSARFGSSPAVRGTPSGFLQWGKPFCDLLDHPAIMPILQLRLGDCFRLDRLYGMCMSQGMQRGGLHADFGASAITSDLAPGERYNPPENRMLHGLIVVAWNLADAGPDHGGFCCIPGSHKSSYKTPRRIQDHPEDAPQVVIPPAPAGSVIVFTEALTHGTSAWNAAHQRRALLYKYSVSHVVWIDDRVKAPEGIELSERQQILLKNPGDPDRHFPSLFAD